MKRKIIFLFSLLLVTTSLCACTKMTDTAKLNELGNEYETSMTKMSASLIELGDMDQSVVDAIEENLDDYVAYGYYEEEEADMQKQLVEDWAEVQPVAGDFKKVKDFEIVKAGKTYTATLTMEFSVRDVELVYVIDAYSEEVTAMNVNVVYTLGETMKKAGLNTVMGILIVFCMLVLMSICIYAFNIIPVIQNKLSKKTTVEPSIEVRASDSPAVVGDTEDVSDDLELVAVIAAAIAAAEAVSTDDFVVRSIRKRI